MVASCAWEHRAMLGRSRAIASPSASPYAMTMRFLFVMDPAQTMLPDKDTSFALMRGAQALGHSCWHCLPCEVSLQGAEAFAIARPISVSDTAPHVAVGAAGELRLT